MKNADPAYKEIEIPEETIKKYYDALIRIYNAKDLPSRDTVVNRTINTYNYPRMQEFTLIIIDTAVLDIKWAQGEVLTGNFEIDKLLLKYNFDLTSYSKSGDYHGGGFKSEKFLNIDTLMKEFQKIDGVDYAGNFPVYTITDNNNIYAEDNDKYIQFKFHEATPWNDVFYLPGQAPSRTPDELKHHYNWFFNVYPDGKVEFTGKEI
ncbi:hypothetical protein JYT51_01405 [Candidatus Amoebophilus asiaticus]|nr:hypothetical protein [Candidatus Amoebophilus asiaticus]